MTDGPAARNRDAMMFRLNLNLGRDQDGAAANAAAAPGGQGGGADNNGGQAPGNGGNGGNGVRMFNFGPLRLGFAQGGAGELQEMAQRLGMDVGNLGVPPAVNNNNNNNNNSSSSNNPSATPVPGSGTSSSAEALSSQLREIEQRIQRESVALRFAEQEASTIRLLLTELQRIRQMAAIAGSSTGAVPATGVPPPIGLPTPPVFPAQPAPQFIQQHNLSSFMPRINSPSVMRLGADPSTAAIPAGSPDLPDGVTLPPGWSLLPLQPLDGNTTGMAPGASTTSQPQIPPEIRAALQQTLQASSAPSHPATSIPSGTAPTSGPTSHPTRGQPSHDSQQDDGGSPAISRSQAAEPVTVAQPTPVMPNWGGPAQLFGRDNSVFGLNVSSPDRSTPVQAGEAGSNGDQQGDEAPPQVSGPDESSSSEAAEHEEQNGSTSKGKARAATVEEAGEDEN